MDRLNVALIPKDFQRIMLFVSITVSMLFILVYYSIAYSEIGIQKIPIGWDTPNYVSGINSVREGLLETIEEYNYVNFLYYIIAASIPASSVIVETYFPILLAMLAVISVALFVRNIFPKEYPMIAASAVFTASSFLLYRITADLHANLLGFILIFSAFAILIAKKPTRQSEGTLFQGIRRFVKSSRGLIFVILVILSSFSHFESTVFFSIVFSMAYTLAYGIRRSKALVIVLMLCLIPSLLLFARHSLDVERFPAELRIFHEPLPYEFLFRPLGVYLPLVIAAGVLLSFLYVGKSKFFLIEEKNDLYFFISFALVWMAISLVIFRTGFYNEGAYPFSYRAATLLPIPFIISIPFYFVNHIKSRSRPLQIASNVLVYGLIFGLGTSNLLFLIENQLPDDSTTFFSDTAYKALEDLQNLNIEQTPIFVYYFHDPSLSPGGLSEYPDRWITAIYGDHYKYLGFTDNLAVANATSFSDIYSRYYSYSYIKDMRLDGMWNVHNISKVPIILIPDFYNVEYFRSNSKFTPLSEHAYLLDLDPDVNGTSYKMSSLRLSNPENWNIVEKNLNGSRVEVLEFYGPGGDDSSIQLSFPTTTIGCYELEARYIDGSEGLGFTLAINDDSRYVFYYEKPNNIHDVRLPYCSNSPLTNITITPSPPPLASVPGRYEFIAFENVLSVRPMTN